MRRGVVYPYRIDSAHYVEHRGMREMHAGLHRLGDPSRSSRAQTSSRPVGVAMNVPALQQFGAPINLNTPAAVASNRVAGGSSKWRRLDAGGAS